MSSGPIEFMGETFIDEKPPSEYGGVAGLIQPERGLGTDGLGRETGEFEGAGHEDLTPSEVAGVMARAGMEPLSGAVQWTGELEGDADVIDPVTGRALDPDASEDVTGHGGSLSDLKP